MNETANDHDSTEPAAELPAEPAENLEQSESGDDTSIRSYLAEAMDAETPPSDSEDGDTETGPDEATAEDVAEGLNAPQSWTEAERAAWADMSETAKQAVLRREQDMQAALRSDAALSKVVEPLAEKLQGTGVHVDQFVDALLKADQAIRTNPHQAIMQLVQQHGLPPQLADHEPAAEPDQALTEVQQLRAELAREREVQKAATEWQAFRAEHPDAERLKGLMASALQQNPSLDYAGAYEQAKSLLSEAGKPEAPDKAAEVERKAGQAEKARRLKLPTGRASSPSEPGSSGDLRDDLRKAMKQAGIMR